MISHYIGDGAAAMTCKRVVGVEGGVMAPVLIITPRAICRTSLTRMNVILMNVMMVRESRIGTFEEIKMSKKSYHVVPYSDRWAVRQEGSTRVSSVYSTKREAIDAARRHAGDLVIHGPTGQIFQKITVSGELSPDLIRKAVRTVSGKRSMTGRTLKNRAATKKAPGKTKSSVN